MAVSCDIRTPLRRGPIAAIVLLGSLAAVSAWQASSPDSMLVRLPRRQPLSIASELVARLTPFQQLETAWLAQAPRALVDQISAAGGAVEVIDPTPAGKTYYLVFAPDQSRCDALRPAGEAWWVDSGVCLFAPRAGRVRETVPADLAIKRIDLPIDGSIQFSTGDLPRAVRRITSSTQAFAPTIAQLAAQVSASSLGGFVRALEGFGTRYASTASCEAAGTYVGDVFRATGLSSEFEYFPFGTTISYSTSNVIATLPGRVDPGTVVVIGAHYDSYSNQAQTLAPGADDNASGTAAVLELARILAPQGFDFTIRFSAWGAEEWGLYGSRYHARQARLRGDRIVAAVVPDMIGYADQVPEDLDIRVNEASQWLGTRYVAAATGYGPLAASPQVRAQFGSDCTSFWEQGYSSACSIEDEPLRNPYYHRTTDTLETLNLDLLVASVRATLALVAELAQPVSTPSPPASLQVAGQTSSSLFRQARSVQLTWSSSRDTVIGYHVYRAATSHGEYRRLTTSPISGLSFVDRLFDPEASFYYVVAAVDAAGRQSSYSAEATENDRR